MVPRIFATVWELLWYYCSPVWGASTWWVWDLILMWLYHSCCLISASLLCLDIGIFFGGFQHPPPPVDGCPTARCDFGVLVGDDEHVSFYSSILTTFKYSVLQPFWWQELVLWKTIFLQTWTGSGGGFGMILTHYFYCVLFFYYYYISFTSHHQALDHGGWDPYNAVLLAIVALLYIKST